MTVPSLDLSQITTVPVALGARAYDILIGRGILDQAGRRLSALAPAGRVALISDETVDALYGERLHHILAEAGLRPARITIPPGESSKSMLVFAKTCDAVLAARVERGDLIVALGGGVVGDLAGFVAASVRRGVRCVQIPTTLLAQVDSAVGGKTGINATAGKNLIGAFHQPSLVISDTALLDTLPPREFRAGYAEVAKYGLMRDAAFFDWCESNATRIFEPGSERDTAVEASCRAKAAIVAGDEFEAGDRALLNLGHTFAHALERLTGYDGTRLVHGEAVSIGLCLAFGFSVSLGLCSLADSSRVTNHLQTMGLPTRMDHIPGFQGQPDAILDAMAQDKKVFRGTLTFILSHSIGDCFIARDIPPNAVRTFLKACLEGQ